MLKKLQVFAYIIIVSFLATTTLSAQCPSNIDFEQGSFANWQTYTGSVSDSGNKNIIKLVNSGVVANRHTIISHTSLPSVDQYGGFPVLCPNGSAYSVKLGNNISGRQAEGISYQFVVPSQNDFSIVYNYAVVFEDPNHYSYEQPRFTAKVFDVAANQYISCASFEYISTANLPGFQSVTVNGTVVRYKSWTPVSINLRGLAGRVIRLEFTTADCTLGAHFGYAYLDVSCARIVTGDNPYCEGKTSISLSGPFGFQGYQWSLNNFGTALDTTRTITLTPPPPANTPLELILIPYAGFGCRDTIHTFIRKNPLPIVDAGLDKTACKGTPVQIGTPALPFTSYSWTSIASTDSVLAQPFVTPATPTTYYLRATSDTSKCTKIDSVKVIPHVVDTSMKVTGVGNSCKASTVHAQFQLLSPPTTIQWYVNGLAVPGATSATFSADTFGLYYAVVKDAFCTDTTRKINLSNSSSTVIGFNVNQITQCLHSNTFVFTNTSTSSDSLQYTWTFGDGGTSTTTNTTHTYLSPGIYEVKLITVNALGCSDTLIKTVEVLPNPFARFLPPATHCMPDTTFKFTNVSLSSGPLTFQWSFGDGGTSTDANPSHTYPGPGTYTVTLIATNSNGCNDTTSTTVTIYPKPIANFSVNNASQCFRNNNFIFTNTSTAVGTTTYLWIFGDGDSSRVTNPSHVYTTPGTDTVKLVISSANGCKDSIYRIVRTYPKPLAGFNVNAVQCLPDINFAFTNTSSGALSYQWSFGDGGASNAVNPSYAYATAGTYVVSLIATGSGGCRDTISKSVTLQARATAGFTINTTSQCFKNNSFTFTNTSTLGVVSTYLWQFGDGTTSAATSPMHVYTNPGTYTVKLIVTSGTTCKDSISRIVNVYPMPIAGFNGAGVQCLPNNSFTFTNTSTISSGSSAYQWSFGDGDTSLSASPTHVYTNPGTFSTKLVVVSNHGCRDSIVKTVKVNPKAIAGFTVNSAAQCYNNNLFTFTNTSTTVGTTSYLWQFGDSITSIATSPLHIYTTAGTYHVMLIAISGNGCKDTLFRTVTVDAKPTPAFAANSASQCLAGNKFVFANTSSISAGSVSYKWFFGDGVTSTTASPAHVYTTAGTYIVKLVATSNNGCKDSIALTVTVKPSPVASFSVNDSTQCMNGSNFTFTNTSSSPSGTPVYTWSFGDGITSALTSPSHVYTSADTFAVHLVAYLNGCTDSALRTVIVYAKPMLAFTANAASQCLAGNRFVFTNASSISSGSVAYLWYFGDGSSLPGNNPAHVYAATGTYLVKLVATSNKGCKDSITQTMTVSASPAASFTINDSTQCLNGNSFRFTNKTINPPGTPVYAWVFGDGGTTGSTSPVHTFLTAGTFNVTLIAGANGCKDSAVKPVTVYPKPAPSFTINNDQQCLPGNNFRFTNTSTISPGIMTYLWSFGDGGMATTTNATHAYASSGSRTVKLVAISNNLCKDSSSHTVVIFDQLAPPTVSVDSATIGANTVTFTWLPVPGATGYQVSVNNGPFTAPSSGVNGLKHVAKNLVAMRPVSFRVRAIGVTQCRTSELATISVTTKTNDIFIPNTFTPNGDGKNDYLSVYCNDLKNLKMVVFNQWGQKLSESTDPIIGWDGMVNGKRQPTGVYVYVATITLNNNTTVVKHGMVNLVK